MTWYRNISDFHIFLLKMLKSNENAADFDIFYLKIHYIKWKYSRFGFFYGKYIFHLDWVKWKGNLADFDICNWKFWNETGNMPDVENCWNLMEI